MDRVSGAAVRFGHRHIDQAGRFQHIPNYGRLFQIDARGKSTVWNVPPAACTFYRRRAGLPLLYAHAEGILGGRAGFFRHDFPRPPPGRRARNVLPGPGSSCCRPAPAKLAQAALGFNTTGAPRLDESRPSPQAFNVARSMAAKSLPCITHNADAERPARRTLRRRVSSRGRQAALAGRRQDGPSGIGGGNRMFFAFHAHPFFQGSRITAIRRFGRQPRRSSVSRGGSARSVSG